MTLRLSRAIMPSMRKSFTDIFKLLTIAEKLKSELRHSWLSCGRQESVAEHSWRLALMVMLFAPHMSQPINLEKALQVAIIHDLVEGLVGDIPSFDAQTADAKAQKTAREQQAMADIKNLLHNATGNHISELWYEFENSESYEAKFVQALDKLECKLQHIEADIATWNEQERAMAFEWQGERYEFDAAITLLRDMLEEQTIAKLNAAGVVV